MSTDGERLVFGRALEPRRRPSPVHREPEPEPPPSRPRYDDEDEDLPFWQARFEAYKRRRRRRKARVAAMTRKRRVARRFMIGGTWFLGVIAAMMISLIVMYYAFTDVPQPGDLPLPQSATIEFADGSPLARIGNVDRTIVELNQIPRQVRWAVLAAEDRNFYNEPSISIPGTARALWVDVTGGDTQGGSTITQQYVKNAYLTSERTFTRKIKEVLIATKLDREYSKDEILYYYLNTVYFGRNAYGIQAAAQRFFGKDVEDLTVSEGALLAALLRSPAYYDPADNPDAAKARWQYVLDGMVTTGHLSAEQAAAQRFPTVAPPAGNRLAVSGWKYFIKQAVLAELARHGISAEDVYDRGMLIRTTIDKRAQKAAVSAVKQVFAHPTKKQRNLKKALVAVNPADGGVLAYYGGSGPDVLGADGKESLFDYASTGTRPPGSSFKPYTLAAVLAQTLDQTEGKAHYAIDSVVDGSYCKRIEGTRICNDPGDQSVSGTKVKISNAMKFSLNTTFDDLASQAGPNSVATVAHAMGVATTDPDGQKTLVDKKSGDTSFGIGIGDYPVSPLDQAVGFATLGNKGVRNDSWFVRTATASDGEVVYKHTAKPTRAIDERVANDVTLTLQPVAGYNGAALADGRVSAAKTGTEGISTKTANNSDAWMVGYTPQVSAAVWVGSGYSQPIFTADGAPMYGKDLPAQAWKLFMDTYLGGMKKMPLAKKQLIAPDGSEPLPTPTYTPPSIKTTHTPKPTFTIETDFPTQPGQSTVTLPSPPSSSSSAAPPTLTCSPVLIGPPKCTTVPPGG